MQTEYEIYARDYYKRRYEQSRFIPPIYRRMIESSYPSEFRSLNLKNEYVNISWERSLGLISEEEASKKFTEKFYEKATIDWMKEFGKFSYNKEGNISIWESASNWLGEVNPLTSGAGLNVLGQPKTRGKITKYEDISWTQLKGFEPGIELEKTETGFKTYIDTTKWSSEQNNLFSKVLSYVFMPSNERIDYVSESLFGTEPYGKWPNPFESHKMEGIRTNIEYTYERAWSEQDWATTLGMVASSPFPMVLSTYALGAGFGILKTSDVGSKALLSYGQHNLTLGGALESEIVAYSGIQTAESFYKNPAATFKSLLFSIPTVIPAYKYGYVSGASWLQRRAGISELVGYERIRQQGLYDVIDQIYKIREPTFKTTPFDIMQIQNLDTYSSRLLSEYITSPKAKYWHKTAIGGSTSTYMQLPEGYFRSGSMPHSLKEYAIKRQTLYGSNRELIGRTKPVDIDLLIRGRFANVKSLDYLRSSHVIDIHKSIANELLGFGGKAFKSNKGKMIFSENYLSDINISVSNLPKQYKSWGLANSLTKEIYLSEDIVFPGYAIKWNTWGAKSQTVYFGKLPGQPGIGLPIPKELSGPSVLLHEFRHIQYPALSRNRAWSFLHEMKTELLEYPAFIKPNEFQAIKNWFETGEWNYSITANVKLMSLREQFMRKSISILPSESRITGYRSYKDIQDWSDLADVFRFTSGNKKLGTAIEMVVNPEMYKIPKIKFGERIANKLYTKGFTFELPSGEIGYNIPTSDYYNLYSIGGGIPSYFNYLNKKSNYKPSVMIKPYNLKFPLVNPPSRNIKNYPIKPIPIPPSDYNKPIPPKYIPPDYTPPLPPPYPPPPKYTTPVFTSSKIKSEYIKSKKFKFKPLFSAYREREWKVPRLKDLFPNMKKYMKGGI